MAHKNPTIVIVDDDLAVRTAVRLLLRSVNFTVEMYGSGDEFLSAFNPDLPGCLLLDIRMPGISGLALQKQLNAQHSTTPVIFMTGHGDVPMAVEAMQNGAFDFIQKPFHDDKLLETINRALKKDEETRHSIHQHDAIRRRLQSLTPREREVLALITAGKANKVVAGDLSVSQRTVEIHRSRVMEKMQASSLAHLVRMVVAIEGDTSKLTGS